MDFEKKFANAPEMSDDEKRMVQDLANKIVNTCSLTMRDTLQLLDLDTDIGKRIAASILISSMTGLAMSVAAGIAQSVAESPREAMLSEEQAYVLTETLLKRTLQQFQSGLAEVRRERGGQ